MISINKTLFLVVCAWLIISVGGHVVSANNAIPETAKTVATHVAQVPEIIVQTGHTSDIYSVAFSPDGNNCAIHEYQVDL